MLCARRHTWPIPSLLTIKLWDYYTARKHWLLSSPKYLSQTFLLAKSRLNEWFRHKLLWPVADKVCWGWIIRREGRCQKSPGAAQGELVSRPIEQRLGIERRNGLSERLFLRARAVVKFFLRAASTLENTDGEQRALCKFSSTSRNLSFINRILCFAPINNLAHTSKTEQ